MQTNRGKQQNGKDQRSLQENKRYQENISWKDGHNKERNGMDLREVEDVKQWWEENFKRTIQTPVADSF